MEGENLYSSKEGLSDDNLSTEEAFVDSWAKDAETCLGCVSGDDDDLASFIENGLEL